MGFRTVTGTIYKPNGNTPWSLASVVFRLVNYFATSEKSYPNQRYAVTASSNGTFSIDLATPDTGYALYTCTLPSDVNETFSFYIATSGTPITLEDLINGAGGIGANVTTVENLLNQLTFLDLVDTPNTFVGQALKTVRVNTGETALEFTTSVNDSYYRHVQAIATAVWTIIHNLGKKPAVSVVDTAGDQVTGVIHYTNDNQVTVTFSAAFAGEAYCN